jgi:hypothetical protein
MARKKSIKKYLKVGSIIWTDENDVWVVTCLLEKTFKCKHFLLIGSELEYTQEFYYTIDMIVFNESARNVPD